MEHFKEILERLPTNISFELENLPDSIVCELEEIRLRCGQRVCLLYSGGEKFLTRVITKDDLTKVLNNIIKYSYYAYDEDLAKGFITIEGGHRIGICGKAVIKQGQPSLIKEISSMNIRFTKEIKGCANSLIPLIIRENRPINTLIVSPPGCGKTTILRDIARVLSMRNIKVGICDERSEIAGMYNSVPSFDLGPRTDVVDGCDKKYGIHMLIRSMSPQVIITDEIGKEEDIISAETCLNTGVSLITSIHGSNMEDLLNSNIRPLINKGFFKNIVFLSKDEGVGTIKEIKSV